MPELPPLNSVDWKKMRGNGSLSGPSWSVIARCVHQLLECAQSKLPLTVTGSSPAIYGEGSKAGCALAGSMLWTICYWPRS